MDDMQKKMTEQSTIGPNLNFAASEAYKLLRTNLTFSLTNNKKCHIVGITSSLVGEGKSTTAANLAYTMAESGKKVLLLEADLRRPSIYRRLGVKLSPGLSNVLVGLKKAEEVMQNAMLDTLFVITAGDVPPNPAELLGSSAMTELVKKFEDDFDYIFVDLPPVNIVADALVVANFVDGIILVVRQDYNSRQALSDAISNFQFINAKLLGFVMTGARPRGSHYKRRGYYRKYGSGYNSYGYGGYGGGYGGSYGYYDKGKKEKESEKKK